MRFGWSEPEGAKMASNITTGTAVICRDQVGTVVTGTVVEVVAGECRGGGLAFVKAVWPGKKRASVEAVELADVEVAA
jgi:hypothetical protein